MSLLQIRVTNFVLEREQTIVLIGCINFQPLRVSLKKSCIFNIFRFIWPLYSQCLKRRYYWIVTFISQSSLSNILFNKQDKNWWLYNYEQIFKREIKWRTQLHFIKGPSINYVTLISWFFDPLPRLCHRWSHFWDPPLPSMKSNILQFYT